ncbi:ribosomal protein S18 acetylase RimI-like enzyme [Catenuloplanes nepalensis]|uniref:Ribosomal protein S18 acetylase RimI-like enzyme n=1 Tax=Catenuloplanes nepalensis TaxID=587533 RepID=A0ABT9MR46_9ACTN|nr:GNAT family N-acetyltransferase [Catenuloplanes nepalensis]MDP9793864.1 ribosomal protein S18 acetylase RimI-like enzyme [Catenuloplanes nepalensis]
MTETIVWHHDLNRAYWMGWDGGSGGDPDAGLPIYRSGVPHALLNGVLRVRDRPIGDAIEEARERLAGVRWIWWAGADSDPGTAEALLAHGAEPAGEVPIMERDLTDVPAPVTVPGLTVARTEDLGGYVRAYAGPNGIPDGALDVTEIAEKAYHPPRGELVRLAGVVDGRIVASTSVLLGDDGVAGLYCVATLDGYRRRGISTALTVEALRLAQAAGHRVMTLQASSMGEPVYRSAGFRTVDSWRFLRLP